VFAHIVVFDGDTELKPYLADSPAKAPIFIGKSKIAIPMR
jgi:hypothetical protein